jgi:uncharacterized Zn finger protein
MNQQQLNIDLGQTTAMTCDKCGGEAFQEVLLLRKASRFVTGTPQDAIIPIPVFACTGCRHINESFLPAQLKDNNNDVEIL